MIFILFLLSCGKKDNTLDGSHTSMTDPIAVSSDNDEVIPRVGDKPFMKEKSEEDNAGVDTSIIASVDAANSISTEKNDASTQSTTSVTKKKKKRVPRKYPVMTFDSMVHHLTDITEGATFSHTFHFENTGEAPLSIKGVDVTCGCTVPSFPFLDIAPGETGVIGVDYHSVGKDGPQRPEITLVTNARKKEVVLAMEFTVLPKEQTPPMDTIETGG